MTASQYSTHETFIQAVRDLVVAQADLKPEDRQRLEHAKLIYGVGDGSYRGVTIYEAWENGVGTVDVVEIAATGEESWIQLAGTIVHELGHVLTGKGHGHDAAWRDLAKSLGFQIRPAAAGQVYRLAMFRPALRLEIQALAASLSDGSPTFSTLFGGALAPAPKAPRPCSAGVGAKGGTSRKAGTSNRQLKATCGCGHIIRGSRSTLEAIRFECQDCGEMVRIVEAEAEAAA